MSSYDVALTSATRANLLSLQNTASLASTNQTRLSTGKAVNSALDNPVNFFTAQNLNTRASSLTNLLDGISNGVQTIQAASKGIDSISSLVKSLQSTITQAQSDAAANRPSVVGANVVTGATNQSDALSKSLTGTGAFVAGNQVTLSAGSSTFTYTVNSTSTVQDFVNSVNSSGIATASVDSTGHLSVAGTGSSALSLTTAVGKDSAGAANTNTVDLTKLGFSSTQVTSLSTGVTATGSSTVRATLTQQFNDITTQIGQLAKDSGYNGTNLLGGNNLSITFNEKTGTDKSSITISGQTLTATSLGITQANNGSVATANTSTQFNIQSDSDLSTMQDTLKSALATLQATSSSLGSSLSTVQTRQDFTKQLADVLNTGAANLTDADTNAEAAKSQALSTRQSLGISALSLANTAAQGVLQLLR